MMLIIKRIGCAFYRIWFYILVTIPILIFFPLLFLLTLSEKTYSSFFWLARNVWARFILVGMGCPPMPKRMERLERGKSYMLVANHTSMLDIMLMLWMSRNPFVFVGKKELSKIPIFGFFYKRVCILVDRENSQSRANVYRRAQRRLDQGLSICIFPEGGVPDEAVLLDTFKDGAFKMAIAHQIPIAPMVFYDNKKRFSFSFWSGGPGPLRAKVLPFHETLGLESNHFAALKDRVRTAILHELEHGPHKKKRSRT